MPAPSPRRQLMAATVVAVRISMGNPQLVTLLEVILPSARGTIPRTTWVQVISSHPIPVATVTTLLNQRLLL